MDAGYRALQKTLGERVKALREARGWSQQQLADQAGIGQSQVSRIEKMAEPRSPTAEIPHPQLNNLYRIATKLGVGVWDLLLDDARERAAISDRIAMAISDTPMPNSSRRRKPAKKAAAKE